MPAATATPRHVAAQPPLYRAAPPRATRPAGATLYPNSGLTKTRRSIWPNLHYLHTGSPRQQRAYATLQATGRWPLLREFGPVLAGTVPLGIDTAGSALDVLCEVPTSAQARFAKLVRAHFGARPGFRLAQRAVGGRATTVSSFRYATETIELFGQALPTAHTAGGTCW